MFLKVLFWLMIFVVFYAYLGYGMILFLLVKLKRLFKRDLPSADPGEEPHFTLLVAAYNELDYVHDKVRNSLELDYPKEKLHLIWVTDGSDDGSPELLATYPEVTVCHIPERHWKIGAMNRGMQFVTSPVVIFSDANSMLGRESVRRIVKLFRNPSTGCVSGEKRIMNRDKDAAAGAGEGIYWKYESILKKWDAELYSVVGAAGELFAIRTALYEEVEPDTLLDDFMISLRIAQKGYTIQYDPQAYAMETASANVKEEFKRKVRISAGGLQSVVRLLPLLNIFRYGILSFQYISHRVLRWTLAPLSLLLLIPVNLALALRDGLFSYRFYPLLFWLQLAFYMVALLGWYLENRSIKVKAFFVPYYFFIMNLSVFLGFRRYVRGSQSVNWDRAKRAAVTPV